MDKLWKLSDRNFRRRNLGRGILLRQPTCGSFRVFINKLVSIIVICPVLAVSCVHTEAPDERATIEDTVIVRADTVRTVLKINPDCDWGSIKNTDILIYKAGGTGELEKHIVTEGGGTVFELELEEGSKECVVVANSTRDLDIKIMERFDTMKSLTFEMDDEDTSAPVMTGHTTLKAGGESVVDIRPFLCRTVIAEVSNALDDWVLMEEPEVFLSNVNPEVEVLRDKDFRPTATQEEGPSAKLPYDIGFYSQYPGTVLHCYPNETPERLLGGSRTSLTMRCKVEGEEIEGTVTLPPFGRDSLIKISITMSPEKELVFTISGV